MLTNVKDFAHDDGGATAIEYGLIAALIAVVIIGSVAALGGGNGGMWEFVKNEVIAGLSGGGDGGDGGTPEG
ncbi:MAG: Flp family type IVb pilin [Janthinobacterium lividum]